MKKLIIALCAAAMAVPLALAPAAAQGGREIFEVVPNQNPGDPNVRNYRNFNRNFRNSRNHYWRGHRGYRNHRPGYRQHNGWWFPPAAFALGAIVGGAIANDGPRYRERYDRRLSRAHVDWCYDRYRSYRASDNTYQPYNGPRRQCNSPY